MKKIFLFILVVLFAWSIVGQAQSLDAWKKIKFSNTSTIVDTIIGPNNEMAPLIYFPYYDQTTESFYDSVLVVLTLTEIANMDSIRIGFDYSPNNTNFVGTYADSVFVSEVEGTFWVTAKPPNAGRVAMNLPNPRYGAFTLWGHMNTGVTDSTALTSYVIYGYKKPTTTIIRE